MTNERTLRHSNGGALKIGTEVHVSADSYCDANSRIYGNSAVLTSTVEYSMVENAQVFNSALKLSHAAGSVIAESSLNRLCVVDCILHKVLGGGYPTSQMRLKDVVAENCELYGNWELSGNARIPTGVWHRSPRFLRITGDGVDFGLTESTNGYAMLGCFRKPLTDLLRAGPRLGRKRGWTGEQIRAAREFYEELGDCPMDGVRV